MFPNAWPLTESEQEKSWFNLKQHGFGRLSEWEEISENEWIQRLSFSSNESFPYSWEVENTIDILEDNSVQFTHTIRNLGSNSMPISTGLHPYFVVPWSDKSQIEWRFESGEDVKSDLDLWSNGWTGMYDVPKDNKITFFIPKLWEICLKISSDYKRFWVWSLPDKDFVCVEPVMGDPGMIVNSPLEIPPGMSNSNFLTISLNT